MNFLIEVEKNLQAAENLKSDMIYHPILGFSFYSHIKTPQNLSRVTDSFSLLDQYEQYQAISEPQRRKAFLAILNNPQLDLEQKIADITSSNQEESKEVGSVLDEKKNWRECVDLYDNFENLLVQHIATTEESGRLQIFDLIMWGFFSAKFFSDKDAQVILNKLTTIEQFQMSGLLNYNQKMRLLIKLYTNWNLDLNASIEKLLENPSLGSKPLSTLVVPEEQLSQIMVQQFALEEELELKKHRAEQERKANEGTMCNMCLVELHDEDEDVFILDSCVHCFHESCLTLYIHSQMKESKVPVKCPEENCIAELTNADLKDLLKKEDFDKLYDLTLKNFLFSSGKGILYCPNPGCEYACFLDTDQKKFNCPACGSKYCLECQNEDHEGSCLENMWDKEIALLPSIRSYKACPACKFWIEKISGCDHMVCRCTFEFCMNCGIPWDIQLLHGCRKVSDYTILDKLKDIDDPNIDNFYKDFLNRHHRRNRGPKEDDKKTKYLKRLAKKNNK